jgi:hypothetical protein
MVAAIGFFTTIIMIVTTVRAKKKWVVKKS